MKLKKVITLICIFTLTIVPAFAIQDGNKTQQNITYTNEVHSVFSLADCINVAIANNPDIRASIYNEQAYKSKIGQAWANYFPIISAGAQFSRTGNKYVHINGIYSKYIRRYAAV